MKDRFAKRSKKKFPITSNVCVKYLAENINFSVATDVRSMVKKKKMYSRIQANTRH